MCLAVGLRRDTIISIVLNFKKKLGQFDLKSAANEEY